MKVIVTTLMGVESLVGEELRGLGYPAGSIAVQNARVVLDAGDAYATACARVNLWTRYGERVLLEFGQAPAPDFDALFDATRALPWEDWIAPGQVILVDGYSRNSALFGVSACQSIIKKAIVGRLASVRGAGPGGRIEEDPARGTVPVRFGIVDDIVSFMADTSGAGLHKRGYRPLRNVAPIRETLAAALVRLSLWNPQGGEALVDPFCGSGTIPIEAAMAARRMAPGRARSFGAENWHVIGPAVFASVREEAADIESRHRTLSPPLYGSDIDRAMAALSAENANRAGVGDTIRFYTADAVAGDGPHGLDRARLDRETGTNRRLVVTNPPYGERLMDPETARAVQLGIGAACFPGGQLRDDLRLTVLSPDETFERTVGCRADKRRKLYNGMIKCTMYHYHRHGVRQGGPR
jgi:putative N6-adenine-specific DNA methylase